MSWTEEKVQKLRELWGKDNTASEIAQILGGVSRNAVIGKAHRLNLSSKIKTRSNPQISKNNSNSEFQSPKKGRKNKFKSLLLDSKFEPAKNLSLEELTEDTCKYTRDKDTLDNDKLSHRIEGNLLAPFKHNPYTHSLHSFAY